LNMRRSETIVWVAVDGCVQGDHLSIHAIPHEMRDLQPPIPDIAVSSQHSCGESADRRSIDIVTSDS